MNPPDPELPRPEVAGLPQLNGLAGSGVDEEDHELVAIAGHLARWQGLQRHGHTDGAASLKG